MADDSKIFSSENIDPAIRAKAVARIAKSPLAFEWNKGQTDSQVKALSLGAGYGLYLTSNEAVMELAREGGKSVVMRTKLVGAADSPRVTPLEKLPNSVTTYIGNDPSKWQKDISTYARIKYESVYPGVDLVYYGNQEQLEYDFIVAPGADSKKIRMSISGAKVRIDEQGNLILHTSLGDTIHHKPVVYQEIDGVRRGISGRYVKRSANEVAFALGNYDRGHDLIIDPSVDFATYIGGANTDKALTVAVDSLGNTIFGGVTASHKFPTDGANAGPYPTYLGGDTDCFFSVIFFQPGPGSTEPGSELYLSTYFGGDSDDSLNGLVLLQAGIVPQVFAIGTTHSPNMPTVNPLQPLINGGANTTGADAFYAHLEFPNVIAYCSYLGGSGDENGVGITLDSLGNIVMAGTTTSTDFPTTNPFQPANAGGTDSFLTKINSTFTQIIYSTYLGGTGADLATGVATGLDDEVYLVGATSSGSFGDPVAAVKAATDVTDATSGGARAFLATLNSTGTTAPFATEIFGGNTGTSILTAVAVNQTTWDVWATGYTSSTNFPVQRPAQAANAGGYDAVLMEFSSAGARMFSTYWGGSGTDEALALSIDPTTGNIFFAGTTNSTNFPVKNAVQSANGGGYDGFITQFIAATGGQGVASTGYSTYFGGSGNDVITSIAVGKNSDATIAGYTSSTNFPVTVGVFQPTYAGNIDAFAARINTTAAAPNK